MERIGEYLVRRLVGEGGMGKVYEAQERLSHRRVALKVMRPELSSSEQGRQMFLNEMTILAHLDHPNIVRSLSCCEVDGNLVMALEFLEGQTLRERLNARGRFGWNDAVDVAVQVASALSAAHGQTPPIIHRDLKPENLMVLANDRIKVMDFGIAKVLQAIRKSTTHSVGTLQYMSPEQVDAAGVDARSDIYCLGLILYEMLGGLPPFESESPRELLNLQCTAEPPPLPDDVRTSMPRGVERIMLQMLNKAPEDRPASAAEVIEALEPLSTAPATSRPMERPPSLVGETPEPPGPEPRPVAAAVHADTIALVEQASRQREIPTPLAVMIALALCFIAGLATYFLGGVSPDDTPRDPSSAEVKVER